MELKPTITLRADYVRIWRKQKNRLPFSDSGLAKYLIECSLAAMEDVKLRDAIMKNHFNKTNKEWNGDV